jgi:hypothetical protein
VKNIRSEIRSLNKELEMALKEYKKIATSYGRSIIPVIGDQGKVGDIIDFVLNDASASETFDVAQAFKDYEALKEENNKRIEAYEKEILGLGAGIRELQKQREAIAAEMHHSGCFKGG